jgi:hypothetical protein
VHVAFLGDVASSVLLRFDVWFFHRFHFFFWLGFGLWRKKTQGKYTNQDLGDFSTSDFSKVLHEMTQHGD